MGASPNEAFAGGLGSPKQKVSSGGRAQRLITSVRPKQPAPYFDSVTEFVPRVQVAADDKLRSREDWISEDEATECLSEALRERGVRVATTGVKGQAAFVNLSLELSDAPNARRYGYRLSVTKEDLDPSVAFERNASAYLRDRRTGSISVAGQGGKSADRELIEGIANDVVQLVPKARRADQGNVDGDSASNSNASIGTADAFIVRTQFEFDPALTARKGYWTAGSAKAYLTSLLRDRGLNVVESPQETSGTVAYINHWIKGKATEGNGADGFDYRYESFYAVTRDDRAYRPILDSRDKGSGEFSYFEDSERLDLEKYADELARSYRESRETLQR